jgi:hypothetical protein
MPTRRSRQGDRTPSDRRHVGLTVPAPIKAQMREAADTLDWSVGDWVLAAAAEHGPTLRQQLGQIDLPRRTAVPNAVFCALYLTAEEVAELDDQAVACGLNRSAFVTAVAALALGADLAQVLGDLTPHREG